MKEPTYFHIPTPCHENWDDMTPEGKGRFCGSCNKQVVDFSLMSDNQVLNYFKQSTGSTCGRFSNDQLQRAMLPATEQKKKGWWMAAMMPFFLFAKKEEKNNMQGHTVSVILDTTKPSEILLGKVSPQIKVQKIDTLISEYEEVTLGTVGMVVMNTPDEQEKEFIPALTEDTFFVRGEVEKKPCKTIMGDTIINNIKSCSKPLFLTGQVTDDYNNKIPYTNVKIKDLPNSSMADSNGYFELQLPNDFNNLITIESSHVSYNTSVQDYSINDEQINIKLQRKDAELPNVTVSAGVNTCTLLRMGLRTL